jgi:uncharacterized protein YecT (DUF1311 family)
MHISVFFAAILTMLPGVSWAGACDKVAANDQLIECLGREFSVADARLNKVYGLLRKQLDTDKKEFLRKSEASWLIYRDTHCALMASGASGGQAYQPTYISCQTVESVRRTRELQELLKAVSAE